MLGIDPEIGTTVLRLWIAAGSAALLVLFCVLALFQPQLQLTAGPARRVGFVIAGALLGAAMAWAFVNAASGDRGVERRALELRADELGAQGLAPGSPLACLDALAGESVETACEKAIFMSPASVASASSYVAARLRLLANMTNYAARGGADIDGLLTSLRQALEADRFGFVAHVLAARDLCTSENCQALALLHDPGRVRGNLGAGTLNHYLERHAAAWATGTDGAVAEPPQAQSSAPPQSNTQAMHKQVNIDFPTAASIPAVSIMNTEPTGPVLPGVAAAAAANPGPATHQATQTPSRRTHKQTANPAAPPASSGAAAVAPIWPEPLPPVPPAPPAQTASAPAGAAPIQLTPPPANASSGGTQRAQ